MVIRFTAFHQTLAAGQFPVRFVDRLNSNYGYPVLNFLYPLPFYLAEIPKAFGFGFTDSIKIVFVTTTIVSALAMFWSLSLVFAPVAALAGSILYIFSPYRFLDLYVRGSIGENVAFMFLPLILGSIVKVSKGDKKYLPLISIFSAGLILSHNVIAALFIPVFLIIAFTLTKKNILQILGALIMGVLSSAFFWLPALLDLKYVRSSQIIVSNPTEHLVSIKDLIIPTWGYSPLPTGTGHMSVQFGIVSIFIFLTTIYLVLFKKVRGQNIIPLLLIDIAVGFVMLKISSHIWELPIMGQIIQFPWRLLSIVMFTTSIFAALIINSQNKKTMLSVIVIAAAIFSTISYTKPVAFTDKGDGYYATNEASTTVREEYAPLWSVETQKTRANEKIVITSGKAQIKNEVIKATNYSADIEAQENSNVTVNSIDFPGWKATVDGKEVPITHDNKFGLINFQLPPGSHTVIIKYAHSSLHLLSEMISLIALIACGAYFINLWRKQNS